MDNALPTIEVKYWFNLGQLFYEYKNYDQYLKCLNEITKIEPDNEEAWRKKRKLFIKLGLNKESNDCLKEIKRIIN